MRSSDSSLLTKVAVHIDRAVLITSTLVATVSLLVLFVALSLEVIVRYITNSSLGWTTELPNIFFPWLVMGGIVLAAQKGQHISVTALLGFLSPGVTRCLFIVLQLILLVVFAYLTVVGEKVIAITGSEVYPMTKVSAKWAYYSLVMGFGGIACTAVTTILRLLTAKDPLSVRARVIEDDV
ncbi:TRAP transporter small permease [Alcaligenes endophyticus]|uniref:TRAP transporter small permease protein n=1 Tax=Alcaligenes endophyticus TaxID=1929088 RepID=A0ABT8EJT8_9BURK|nr:TRAP transporter small permease [Alcaligenes endophyticus]MCX5591866.1 TRAP transporter small permease [Alcaligenes endophyticus]MDN4121556.1 TRAP transporter small permease [Alcaligenes endophyticus]